MTDYDVFPDIEAMCSQALRAANVCGGRVFSSIPARPTWPLAVVTRLGGVPADRRALDAARIQVDVWGTNKTEARDGAAAARRELHRMEGATSSAYAGFVTGVDDELGLMFLPDHDTGRDRYTFAVVVSAHSVLT